MSSTEDEIVTIEGLWAFIDLDAYERHLRIKTANGYNIFKAEDMPVRVHSIYPATPCDSAWIGVSTASGISTSFPIDLIARFTNIAPEEHREIPV